MIPEDIASYMDYSGINMEECFQLTHDEYENGNVDRIVKYIEKNWKMVVSEIINLFNKEYFRNAFFWFDFKLLNLVKKSF